MTDEELANVREMIVEVVALRHKNRKLMEAIKVHKASVEKIVTQYDEFDAIDIELWKAIE